MHGAWNTCPTAATSFQLNHAPPPNSPKLNVLFTRFKESFSSLIMNRESKRLNKARSDWLNSGNALIQNLSEKMRFSCFPVLSGITEAHVIWCGTVFKRLLIAYFIGNISAKKYQNAFMCVKVIAKQRWDVFWDSVVQVQQWPHTDHQFLFNRTISTICTSAVKVVELKAMVTNTNKQSRNVLTVKNNSSLLGKLQMTVV